MSNFYGTEIETWAGFGPVGSSEKKNWVLNYYATFEGSFFMFSWANFYFIFFQKHCSVFTPQIREQMSGGTFL